MKRYDHYKPTGISWLPEIPAHWDMAQLRKYLSLVSIKGKGDKQLLSVTREKGVIVRNVDDLEENHNFVPDDLSGYKYVQPGQFVINKMKSWQGSYGVSEYEGIVSPAYYVCDLKFPNKTFFSKAIRSRAYVDFFAQWSKGIRVGQWDLEPIALKSIPFFEPPIGEQEKIVAYLDKQMALIESCVSQRERELQTLNELKQAEIAAVVTQGLNPDVPKKDSGIPWIGQIPAHWTMMRIKNLLEESKVKSIDGHEQSLSLSKTAGIIPYEEKENRTMQSASLIGAKVVQCGDVVFNRFKARLFAISNYDGVVSPDYAVYKGKGRANLNYLVSLFGTEMYRAAFDRKASGIGDGFSRLYTADLFSMYAIFPPIEEQNEIVKYIALKTNQIDTMIEAIRAEIDRLTEYKQRLISDVVTGQLNVQDEIA